MPNEYNISNQINKVISLGGDSFLKVANKIPGENKQLIAQLNQKACYAIKSYWRPLCASWNEATARLVQSQAKDFYTPGYVIRKDKDFIFLKDQKNLQNRLNEIRDIILSAKNNSLDFENKDFLCQIDSLLKELEVTKGLSENRWTIINNITNSLFLFFNKNKFGPNKKKIIAQILLVFIKNNNLEVEQISFIKKFNKYLNTGANSELDNFIKELDNFQLFKQAYRTAYIQEMKAAANSLIKLNYNAIYEINENLGENKYKKIKPRIIDFDDKGIGFTVSLFPKSTDKESERAISNQLDEGKHSDNSIIAEVSVALEGKIDISQEELIVLNEFKRLGKINVAEIERSSKGSSLKEYSLETKNELLYAELWRKIECIEKSEKIRVDKIKKRKFAKKLAINEERKRSLEYLLSPLKKKIEEFNAEKNNAKNEAYFNLPFFENNNNDFLDYINFKYFEELMNEARETFFSIKKMVVILKKIDDFSYKLGLDKICLEDFNQEIIDFNKIFNKEAIGAFFKNALQLFEEYKLNPSEVNRIISCKSSNKFEKVTFYDQDRLDDFICYNGLESIIKNRKIEIKAYLDKYFNKDILFNEKIIENKFYRDVGFFRIFFEKIKRFIMNFSGNYFISRKSKLDFLIKLKINGPGPLPLDSINDFILKLKWWHLIFYGVNPFCVYKKGFKRKLSEQLFLALIEGSFKKVINNLEKTTRQSTRIECTDELSVIINRLRILDRNDGDNIEKKSKSRYEIIDELEKDIIKELPEKLFTLKKQANLSLNRFSELSNLSKTAIETLTQVKEVRNSGFACSESNFYFFNWLQRKNKQADTSSNRPFPRQSTS